MKYYKVLQLFMMFCLVASCSQDTDEQQIPSEPEVRIAQNQFDYSYKGVYKGLFTTNDGLTRGSVELNLTATNEGIATITLSSGEQIELKSSRVKLTVDNTVSNLRFSSEGWSAFNATLEFSVNGNGSQPTISNVTFDNQASDILIAKNLSRAPLTPITGTYVRTSGTGGFPTTGRTWNVMTIGEGDNQMFATQVYYGGRAYNTPAENNMQSNCIDVSGLTSCDVNGALRVLGYDVTWTGTHSYSLGSSQCSGVSGTWASPTYGNSVGTFTSDVDAAECVVEGGDFEEIVIGEQTWMLENLDVITYSNGDPIPQVDAATMGSVTYGAWCYVGDNPVNGIHYNGYAVRDSRGLAPQGWHILTNDEWTELRIYLGGATVAGGKMKTLDEWDAPNVGATNESGFTGLPKGYSYFGTLDRGAYAYFWNSNATSYGFLQHDSALAGLSAYNFPEVAFSIRCVKD